MTDFFPESDKILPLTFDDFNNGELVKNDRLDLTSKIVCVLFFAPWCGHCKMFKPIFVQSADMLFSDKRIVLAAFDCTTDTSSIKPLKVAGFPTVMLFRNGRTVGTFQGNRDANSLVNFVRNAKM